jgi:hypothetical protein
MTSRDQVEGVRRGHAAGVTGFFVEPLPLGTLVGQVSAVLLAGRAGPHAANP